MLQETSYFAGDQFSSVRFDSVLMFVVGDELADTVTMTPDNDA